MLISWRGLLFVKSDPPKCFGWFIVKRRVWSSHLRTSLFINTPLEHSRHPIWKGAGVACAPKNLVSLVHLKRLLCFRCVSDRFLGAQVTAGARVVLRGRRSTL